MKKLSAILLTFALCLGLFVGTASAATQQEAVDWAKSQVGKSIDFDGYCGAQCVDLTMKYCYKVFGFRIGGNGCDYRDHCSNEGHSANKLPAGWTRTKYSKGDIPQPGDIIVYIPRSPGYPSKNGHVSICVSANAENYTCVSQSGGKTKLVSKRSYSGVWGFIHPVYSEKGKPTVVFSNYQVRKLSETSAEPYATVNATGEKVTEVGMYIGLAEDSLEKLGSDNGKARYKKNMWYNTTKYGYPLEPGTTYYYQPYAVVGGETYKGSIDRFTTTGTKKVTEPEADQVKPCTEHVKGTYIWFDGDHPHKDAYYCAICGEKFLDDSSSNYYDQCAICDPPKEETKPANLGFGIAGIVHCNADVLNVRTGPGTSYDKVVQIPNGSSCTVYTAKTSNGWYYVEYEGAYGYAAGNKIALGQTATATCKADLLNVRTGPGTSYDKVVQIPRGDTCVAYPDIKANGWVLVEYNGAQGYAAGNYITLK